MTRRFVFLALVVASIMGVVLSGCFDKSTKPKPRDCQDCLLARTSPANVLNNLRVIYSVMDNNLNTIFLPENVHTLVLKYRDLFDPQFKFYFVSGDAPPSFPQGWWGRDDEVAGFDTLMTKRALGIVTEIELSWSPGTAVPDSRLAPDPPYLPLHPDWMWIHVSSVLLDVVEGDHTYRVANGLADFYLGPDPADSTLWVITEWKDRQPGYSLNWSRSRSRVPMPYETSSWTSWGKIKGLFR
jgi:hypothetical protein